MTDLNSSINSHEYREIFSFDKKVVDEFIKLSGDSNEIHYDQEFAESVNFKAPIAHGALAISYISRIIGMKIPGSGALWTDLSIRWLKPIFIGDEVEFTANIITASELTSRIEVSIVGKNTTSTDIVFRATCGVSHLNQKEKKNVSFQQPSEEAIPKDLNSDNAYYLVTGASGDVGKAVTEKLLSRSLNVLALTRDKNNINRSDFQSIATNANLKVVEIDLSNEKELKKLSKNYLQEYAIKGFVHCAASPLVLQGLSSKIDYQQEFSGYAINVLSFRYIINNILENHNSNVSTVCILSEAIIGDPPKNYGSYCSYKSALYSLIKQYCIEYGPIGHKFNGISPGLIDNDYSSTIPRLMVRYLEASNPSRRLTVSKDVAELTYSLISDPNIHINGQNILVNGGSKLI